MYRKIHVTRNLEKFLILGWTKQGLSQISHGRNILTSSALSFFFLSESSALLDDRAPRRAFWPVDEWNSTQLKTSTPPRPLGIGGPCMQDGCVCSSSSFFGLHSARFSILCTVELAIGLGNLSLLASSYHPHHHIYGHVGSLEQLATCVLDITVVQPSRWLRISQRQFNSNAEIEQKKPGAPK